MERGTWKLDCSAGIYINSFNDLSAIATIAKMWPLAKNLEAGLFAGTAYYQNAEQRFLYHAGNFIPVTGLQARRGNSLVRIMPDGGKSVDAIVVLSHTVPLEASRWPHGMRLRNFGSKVVFDAVFALT